MTSKSTSTTSTTSNTGKRYPRALRHKVVVRASEGCKPRDLAKEFDVSATTIYKWCQRAKQDGIEIPDLRFVDKEDRYAAKMVRFEARLAYGLEEERKRRGYPSVARLLHAVLTIMVEEPNLFDAVLDGD